MCKFVALQAGYPYTVLDPRAPHRPEVRGNNLHFAVRGRELLDEIPDSDFLATKVRRENSTFAV